MFEQNQIVQYPATLLGAKKFKGDIDGNKIDSCQPPSGGCELKQFGYLAPYT